MVCTSDLFARNADGKAVGLERVTTVLEDVSEACCERLLVCDVPRHLYWHTFAGCAADGAGQNDVLLSSAAIKQVTAFGAEDQGADCGHCGELS